MAVTGMTLDKVLAKPSRMDRATMDATTEADLAVQSQEDGHDPASPLRAENTISPSVIRKNLRMSQSVFANVPGIPVTTLRNWE